MVEPLAHMSRYARVDIPEWCSNQIDHPSLASLDTDEKEASAIDLIYHDTLEKHRIMEAYAGIRANGPCALLRALSEQVIKELRSKGTKAVTSMGQGIGLVSSHTEAGLYRLITQYGLLANQSLLTRIGALYLILDSRILRRSF